MLLSQLKIQYPLFAPVEVPAATSSKAELTKDDIVAELGKDEEVEPIPLKEKDGKDDKKSEKEEEEGDQEADEDDKEDKDDDEEEVDDLELLEDELEEPDEEKLELTTPISRREILKKYPKLFKEFPALEKAYYREQEFTKILPTISDAKEAVEKSEVLDKFETDLADGNIEKILRSVKDNVPQAFYKIADDYLMTLAKVDKDAYHHVLGNITKHTILSMVQEARASKNEALEEAASILNQFVFGTSKFSNPTKLSSEEKSDKDSDREKQIAAKEAKYKQTRFESANKELNDRVGKAYKATLEANIDPKGSMTDYVKRTAIRNAVEEVEQIVRRDTRFKTLLDKLWEKALNDDFSSESIARIRSAFISKAQTVLPAVIKKHRNEALKGMNRKAEKDDDSRPEKEESKKGDEQRRRSSSKGGESHHRDDSKKVPAGMSSIEYLMSED